MPLYGDAEYRESNFHGVVDMVGHIPIDSESPDYEKKLDVKTVYSEFRNKYFDLEILDFQMTRPIKITTANREEVRIFLRKYLEPQFRDFYRNHEENRMFISRLTFRRKAPVTGEDEESGVGTPRWMVFEEDEFIDRLLKPLLSKRDFMRTYDARGILKNDYLAASFGKTLYFTGFTVETIVSESDGPE